MSLQEDDKKIAKTAYQRIFGDLDVSGVDESMTKGWKVGRTLGCNDAKA